MRVTMDANVLVSAAGWDGPEARLLRAAFRGEVDLVMGVPVVAEFVEVMGRPKLRFVPREDLVAFLVLLLRRATLVEPAKRLTVIEEDPPDNRVLEAAVAGGCDLIVSGDRHLLDLGAFEGIDVVRAPEALARLGGTD